MSYHINEIPKGVVGELSKIYEEVAEIKDSEDQGASLMVLIEISDLVGAITLYLEKHHPSLTIEDMIAMSNITRRAFESGARGK